MLKDIRRKDYLKEQGFFSFEFPIKETMEFEGIDFKVNNLQGDLMEISNSFKFKFGECGAMIGDRIISQRYIPKECEPTLLSDVIQGNVGEEFYLGKI